MYMADFQTIIRASSLTYYTDCMRRSAARMFPADLKEYGYEIRDMPGSIAATVGTATHRALEAGIRFRKDGKAPLEAMEEAAAEILTAATEGGGLLWDKLTKTREDGITQAVRQAEAALSVLPEMKHIEIEGEFKADLEDGFILSGHVDLRGTEEKMILDLKTGTRQRSNIAQYGGYSLLARANGHEVRRLGEIFVPRVSVKRPQPAPTLTDFDIEAAERLAWATVQRIKEDLQRFRNSGGDPWVWIPNPNSMMCSKTYCPVFATSFCTCRKDDTPPTEEETTHD